MSSDEKLKRTAVHAERQRHTQDAKKLASSTLRRRALATGMTDGLTRVRSPLTLDPLGALREALTDRLSGRPVPEGMRRSFSELTGKRLGDVRLHDGARASAVARTLDAVAVAVGQDVFFSEGALRTDTAEGRAVLGHELAHTVQAPAASPESLSLAPATSLAEVQADHIGGLVANAVPTSPSRFESPVPQLTTTSTATVHLLRRPMVFPFRTRTSSYTTGGRVFGANRSGGRKHGGCDLLAPRGTEILAVDDGVVLRGPYAFYSGTYALEVNHGGETVRYGEILSNLAPGVSVGGRVRRGQLLCYVGRLESGSSMLHFEMYSGSGGGGLTVRGNPPYQRRADLRDPTGDLDSAVLASEDTGGGADTPESGTLNRGTVGGAGAQVARGASQGAARSASTRLSAADAQEALTYNEGRQYAEDRIRRIQTVVGVEPSGRFDTATVQAVAQFQGTHGLTVDGKVGPNTLTAIERAPATAQASPPPRALASASGGAAAAATPAAPTPAPPALPGPVRADLTPGTEQRFLGVVNPAIGVVNNLADAEQAQRTLELNDPTRQARVTAQAAAISNQDVVYEQLAHRFAYEPNNAGGLLALGYLLGTRHEDPVTSLQVYAFLPNPALAAHMATEQGRPVVPVVAFRGTVPTEAMDVVDDLNREGIGAYQFAANEPQIRAVLAAAMGPTGQRVDVVGHSLGGALAQIAACHFPQMVRRIVTFQAPAVSADEVRDLVRNSAQHGTGMPLSTHYRAEGDLVSTAGQVFTPGVAHELQAAGTATPASHTDFPLAQLHNLRGGPFNGRLNTTGSDVVGVQTSQAGTGSMASEIVRQGTGILADEPGMANRIQGDDYARVWRRVKTAVEQGQSLSQADALIAAESGIMPPMQQRMMANLRTMYPNARP